MFKAPQILLVRRSEHATIPVTVVFSSCTSRLKTQSWDRAVAACFYGSCWTGMLRACPRDTTHTIRWQTKQKHTCYDRVSEAFMTLAQGNENINNGDNTNQGKQASSAHVDTIQQNNLIQKNSARWTVSVVLYGCISQSRQRLHAIASYRYDRHIGGRTKLLIE